MTEPQCTCRWNQGKEPGGVGWTNTHHVECPRFTQTPYYRDGYRKALVDVITKLDTESVTLRLGFRAGKVGIEYINGIEHASDMAHALLEGVQGD